MLGGAWLCWVAGTCQSVLSFFLSFFLLEVTADGIDVGWWVRAWNPGWVAPLRTSARFLRRALLLGRFVCPSFRGLYICEFDVREALLDLDRVGPRTVRDLREGGRGHVASGLGLVGSGLRLGLTAELLGVGPPR